MKVVQRLHEPTVKFPLLFKEVSSQGKETIIRLKNKTNLSDITETLEGAKSTMWCIVKKREFMGKLAKNKEPGRPQKTSRVNDHRILSLVKKNPFIKFQPNSRIL